MSRVLLGLGANIGDRAATLNAAVEKLIAAADVRLIARSRWHETAPVGGPAGQDVFLNGAITVETSLAPESLLARLHEIERTFGRERTIAWGPRSLDIDMLLYDELRVSTPDLRVPHPRMAVRRFVLAPAVEIAAEWLDPASGWTIERLWEHLRRAFPYFALTSIPGASLTTLAQDVRRAQPSELSELLSDVLPTAVTAESLANHQRQRARLLEQLAARGSQASPREALSDAEQDADKRMPGATAVISDFWFDEIPVIGRAFAEARSLAESAPLEPKVLVWVEPARCEDDWSKRVREALYEAASRPGRGPWLCVSEADWAGAVREIAAAVAGS